MTKDFRVSDIICNVSSTKYNPLEIFCIADDFCKVFDAQMAKYTFKAEMKRKYHRESRMSKAEIMVIMILFHSSGYRCLKHFYLEKVCKHMRHLFPEVVSYNRFVELEREIAMPLIVFVKKVLPGKCTGISFVDSTPSACMQESEDSYAQDIQGRRTKRQMLHGLVLWVQAS